MHLPIFDALGNVYTVLDARKDELKSSVEIANICRQKNTDGLLYGPLISDQADVGVRIFNSDGSEAEKSGNGVRIFYKFLKEEGSVSDENIYRIETKGGIVECIQEGENIAGNLGIPKKKVLGKSLSAGGRLFECHIISMGNPHCVCFFKKELTANLVKEYGPLIERHSFFPEKTNVQFAKIVDRGKIRAEIWERGSGYTLSSGSSSCAVFAAARALGLCDTTAEILMPGGILKIREKDHSIWISGPIYRS